MGVRLGRFLAQQRERIRPKLTQEGLGERVGRGRLTIHNWESGKSTPARADRLLLSTILEADIDEMDRLVDLDRSDDGGLADVGSPVEPRLKSKLPQAARIWVQEFLADLIRGGADEIEVESARSLLTAPALTEYLAVGPPGFARLSDDEVVAALEAFGEGAIKRVLRRRGRDV